MGYVVYSSNNSGGYWWLDDEDWAALEAAGWTVVWTWLSEKYNDDGGYERDPETGVPLIVPVAENNSRYILRRGVKPGDRWLGALATTAYRAGLSLRQAVDEWERITGENSTAAGCPCCGQPHSFTEYTTEGKYVASGPETVFEARWS